MNTAVYSLLTLRPDPERIDMLCVGVVVLDADNAWHISVLPNPEKLRCITPSASSDRLGIMSANLRTLLADCDSLNSARALLGNHASSFALHPFEGEFAYRDAASFDAQTKAIMHESVLVNAPASLRRTRVHARTRAQLKQRFEAMGIMARYPHEINDHKVVRNYPVSEPHGLTAEFALKNSSMHLTETVDFGVADGTMRSKALEAQAKCLVMHYALESFGDSTKCYFVISGEATGKTTKSVDLLRSVGEVYAADSGQDMSNYYQAMAQAANI